MSWVLSSVSGIRRYLKVLKFQWSVWGNIMTFTIVRKANPLETEVLKLWTHIKRKAKTFRFLLHSQLSRTRRWLSSSPKITELSTMWAYKLGCSLSGWLPLQIPTWKCGRSSSRAAGCGHQHSNGFWFHWAPGESQRRADQSSWWHLQFPRDQEL